MSSFLYRKVVPLLAELGLRGVAFDLPGLGLAERPTAFDYSWSGLGRWTGDAIDAGYRSVPSRAARHRRSDRARMGASRPRSGSPTDRARHADRRGRFPAPLGDGDGGPAADRPAWVMTTRPPAVAGCSTQGNRGSLRDPRPRGGRAHRVASPGRRRSGLSADRPGTSTAEKERFYVGGLSRPAGPRIVWAESDPALGETQVREVEEARRGAHPSRQALPPGGPGAGDRRTISGWQLPFNPRGPAPPAPRGVASLLPTSFAALGERDLDQVEVARRDRVREHRAPRRAPLRRCSGSETWTIASIPTSRPPSAAASRAVE